MRFSLVTSAAALVIVGFAVADFDGPAPLAWRWAESSSVSPSGQPIVEGDTVYVALGGRIYALEQETGNQVWRYPIGEPLSGNFRFGITKSGNAIIGAADDGTVVSVDATSGELLWRYIAENGIAAAPVQVGNRVAFVAAGNVIHAVDAASGDPVWEQPVSWQEGIFPNLSSSGSNLIFFTDRDKMVALNINSGQAAWESRFQRLSSTVGATLLSDIIYVNSGTFIISANALTGRARWQQNVNTDLLFAPAVGERYVASVSRDAKLFVFDLQGRAIQPRGIQLANTPNAAPIMVGDKVAVPTVAGEINLIDAVTGDLIWTFVIPPMTAGGAVDTDAAPTGQDDGGAFGGGLSGGGGAAGGAAATEVPDYIQAAGPAAHSGDRLFIQALDGSLLMFSAREGVDLTPPTAELLWPRAGQTVSGRAPMEIILRLQDIGSGINPETVRIYINDNEYGGIYTSEGFLSVRITAGGTNQPLQDGLAVVKVECADWMGNTLSKTFDLLIDNSLPALGSPPRSTDQQGGQAGGRQGLGGGQGAGGG